PRPVVLVAPRRLRGGGARALQARADPALAALPRRRARPVPRGRPVRRLPRPPPLRPAAPDPGARIPRRDARALVLAAARGRRLRLGGAAAGADRGAERLLPRSPLPR